MFTIRCGLLGNTRFEQGLAEGNCTLASRSALEAKEAKAKAEQRAEQAEAQVKHDETGACRDDCQP